MYDWRGGVGGDAAPPPPNGKHLPGSAGFRTFKVRNGIWNMGPRHRNRIAIAAVHRHQVERQVQAVANDHPNGNLEDDSN